jgi:hypothetical protein
MRADGCQAQAAAQGPQQHFDELGAVAAHQRHRIAALQPQPAQVAGKPVGGVVQLGKAARSPR